MVSVVIKYGDLFRCFFENIVHEIDDYQLLRDGTIGRWLGSIQIYIFIWQNKISRVTIAGNFTLKVF